MITVWQFDSTTMFCKPNLLPNRTTISIMVLPSATSTDQWARILCVARKSTAHFNHVQWYQRPPILRLQERHQWASAHPWGEQSTHEDSCAKKELANGRFSSYTSRALPPIYQHEPATHYGVLACYENQRVMVPQMHHAINAPLIISLLSTSRQRNKAWHIGLSTEGSRSSSQT